MTDVVAQLLLQFGADLARLDTDMRKAVGIGKRGAGQMEQDFIKAGKAIGTVFAGAITAVSALTKNAINNADGLGKLSQKVGVSVEALSKLQYVAKLSDVALNDLQGGLSRLTKAQADAARGSTNQAAAFNALGISVKDAAGNLRPVEAVLTDLGQVFSVLPDGPQKTAVAMDLLGKSGANLIPFLNSLGKEGKKLGDELAAMGGVITGEVAEAAETFNDNLTKLQTAAGSFGNAIAQALLPSLVALTDQFVEGAGQGEAFRQTADGIATTLKVLVAGFVTIAAGARATVQTIAAVVEQISVLNEAAKVFSPGALASSVAGGDNPFTSILERQRQATASAESAFAGLGDEVERLSAKYLALFNPAAAAAGAVEQTAESGKKANPEIEALQKRIADLLKKLQGVYQPAKAAADGIAATGKASDKAADAVGEFNAKIDSLLDAIEGRQLNQAAADMVQLQIALEGAIAAGDNGRIERITAALAALGDEVRVLPSDFDRAEQGVQEFGYRSVSIAEEFANAWNGVISSVAGAFGDFVARGFKGWKGFLSDMKNALRRWVSEVVSIMAQRALIQAFSGAGGGWGAAFSAALGGAGGGGGGAGSLAQIGSSFAGGGSGFGGLGGGNLLTAQYGGTYIAPYAAAAAGGLYGLTNRGSSTGSAGSLAAAASYGYLGYAAGTVALGAGLGAAGGAAVGAAGAGALSGAAGAAAAIPVVGWIIAALALIDAVSGGKLFGTRYTTKGFESSIGITSEGGIASLQARQTRQAALFGGIRTRFKDVDPGDEARAAAEAVFGAAGDAMATAARRLAIEVPEIIGGAFRQTLDKKGNVKEEWSEVLGKKYKEDFEAFQKRLAAEQVIAAVATLDASASQLAERYRANADTLADAAEAFLNIQSDIVAGVRLLGDDSALGSVLTLVEDLKTGSEGLAAAYERIKAATQLLDQALQLSGVSLDRTREEIVRFASDISQAAGGLDQAAQLWNAYFQNFYSAQERALGALTQAQATRDSQLTSLGVDTGIGGAAFRALFEERLPQLTAEQVVQWLRAADAIAQANAALSQYAQALGLSTDALQSYGSFVAALNRELDPRPVNDLQAAFDAIYEQERQLVAEANRLARAAGMEAAAEEDLARVHTLTARRIAEAIRQYETKIRDLVQQIFGSPLDQVESQISVLEEQRDAYLQSQQAARDLYEEQQRGIEALRRQAQDLLLGDLSPLRGRAKLEEALRQLTGAAARGDAGRVGELAQRTLEIGRGLFASGADYNGLFARVQGILNAFGGNLSPNGPNVPGFDFSALQRLYEERDRLLREQERLYRADLAEDLLSYVSNLALVSGRTVEDILAGFGVTLEGIAAALGISVEDLLGRIGGTVPTFTQLPDGTNKPSNFGVAVPPPNIPDATTSTTGTASIPTAGISAGEMQIIANLRRLIEQGEEDRRRRILSR